MLKNFHIWGPSVVYKGMKRIVASDRKGSTRHILFCVADHFEPGWNNVASDTEKERVRRWAEEYPKLASAHKDSSARPPQHTFFYAAEQYNAELLEKLSSLCRLGYGEIELHLHHEDDTPEGLREKLERAKIDFSRHGALITGENPPKFAFGFIHGNFALNNSREGGRWCGVDNELRILRDSGCYADFTEPSAPVESQTHKVNSIYYAHDIPYRRKSHDRGIDVEVGGKEVGDLMLIQGPLALNWLRRKCYILPRIENGCVQESSPGTPERMDLWVQQNIHVIGRPEWIFIKVYCHGAQEADIDALLGENAHRMYFYLEENYNDGERYQLHYITAREMYNIIKAAEHGYGGNPTLYKDYIIKPYLNSK